MTERPANNTPRHLPLTSAPLPTEARRPRSARCMRTISPSARLARRFRRLYLRRTTLPSCGRSGRNRSRSMTSHRRPATTNSSTCRRACASDTSRGGATRRARASGSTRYGPRSSRSGTNGIDLCVCPSRTTHTRISTPSHAHTLQHEPYPTCGYRPSRTPLTFRSTLAAAETRCGFWPHGARRRLRCRCVCHRISSDLPRVGGGVVSDQRSDRPARRGTNHGRRTRRHGRHARHRAHHRACRRAGRRARRRRAHRRSARRRARRRRAR